MQRLERAMELWLEFRAQGGDAEAFLERNDALRDLLEPMLAGEPDADLDTDPGAPADDAAPSLRRGSRIGPFRLQEELGRGGMGVVWAAEQEGVARSVALKLLPLGPVPEPRRLARFRREAAAAGQLDHPHIVGVHALGGDERLAWIAMEKIDGRPLGAWADRVRTEAGGRTEAYVRRVAGALAQVADALAHAHERGVVHRDIKPSNILVRDGDHAMLTDFGISRRSADPALTQTGEFAGTPDYASPEQARGDADVDARTDIFSLGATFYEQVTGTRPFSGTTTQGVLDRVQKAAPPHPRAFGLGADACAVLLKALAKDRRDRYQDARAFAEDLRRLEAGSPVVARPVRPWVRLGRTARARPWAVVAAAGLLALIGVALALGIHAWTSRDAIAQVTQAEGRVAADRLLLEGALARFESPPRSGRELTEQALAVAPEDPAVVGIVAVARGRGRQQDAERALRLLDARETVVRDSAGLRRLYHHLAGRAGSVPDASIAPPPARPTTALDHFVAAEIEMAGWHGDPAAAARAQQLLMRCITLSEHPRAEYFIALRAAAQGAGDGDAVLAAVDGLVHNWPDSATAWAHRATGYALPDAALDEAEQARRVGIAGDAARRSLELAPDNFLGLSVQLTLAELANDEDGKRAILEKLQALHPQHLRWLGVNGAFGEVEDAGEPK